MKVLILAGGKGTRLWPISRRYKPKQFQKFIGDKTMLQMTFERVLPFVPAEDIFVSTNQYYLKEVKKEIPQLPKKNIILEPAFRERVAAFLLFFSRLSDKELREPVCILPSDHLIEREKQFLSALKTGTEFIKKHPQYILLFGERPDNPDVGLGYIKKGRLLEKIGRVGFYRVDNFKEKPNLKIARQFVKSKNYFWNTGIFIFSPKLIEKLTKKFVPDNYRIYEILRKSFNKEGFQKILKKEYLKMDVVSFDYSILENYQGNVVSPVSIGWADIGSWDVLKEKIVLKGKNPIRGNFLGVDSKDILVYGTSPQLIAACGISNLIIVSTDDVIFICKKSKSQDIKKLIEAMKRSGRDKYL